jgi:outer membrane lipoprotein-sorting protein
MFFTLLSVDYLLSQNLTGEQIIKNMKARNEQIKDYTVDIEANLNMENIRMPKIKIKMYFKQPDKFHYESKNFALLPKSGINFNPLDYPEDKFNITVKGNEMVDNVQTYILEIERKKPEKGRLDKTILWVEAANWVPKKITNEPNDKRKVSIKFDHSWIDGKFYMPSKIDMEYDIAVDSIMKQNVNPPIQQKQRAFGMSQGKGAVSITFKNYQVNIGLSDDIFKEKEKSK